MLQIVLLSAFGLHATFGDNLLIVAIFSAGSIMRS